MLKICFITDGGTRLGLGHVQQSMAFARELGSHAEITFLTKSDQSIVAKIAEAGFNTIYQQNDSDIFRHLLAIKPHVIIFDKLDVEEKLAKKINETLAAKLVIFTNLTKANKYADIVVTADFGSRFENVRFWDEQSNTTYLYGPKYWVLRPEFYYYQKIRKVKIVKSSRVLLIFGGSDPANLTTKALDQLLQMQPSFLIDIILGSHYPHNEDLEEIFVRHPSKIDNIKIYKNVNNVAELMHRADLVLAAPGLSAFEALCVNTPIIVVPHDELQRETYQGFFRMLKRDELSKLAEMIEIGDFTYPDDNQILRMEIGRGIHELKELVINSNRN